MRPRWTMSFVVALVSVAAAQAPFSRYEPDWNKPAPPLRIIANIYFVGTNELAAFLITTPRGHILMDPGFEETVPLLKRSIRALGFKYEDIRLLLTSQAHFDHAAALALIKKETGARLEAMAEDAAALERGGKDDFVFGDDLSFPPVTVDRVLRDGDAIEQGGVRLIARHTPGHTKGATTFTTIVSERGWSYQAVFAASTTVNPGTMLLGNPKYPHIVEDWQRTYAILDSMSPGVWLSAHTGVFDLAGKRARVNEAENPFIDPKGYRRFLQNSRGRFADLLAAEVKSEK